MMHTHIGFSPIKLRENMLNRIVIIFCPGASQSQQKHHVDI